MSKEREFLKSGIWYTVGNVLVKAIAFLALPLFTNLLTTEEFGIFATYNAYEIILSVFVSCGISGTVRAAYNDYKADFERYISSITIPIILITLGLIILDGVYAFIFHDSYISLFVLALILNCLGNSIREILSSRYVILNKYKQNLLMSFLMSVLNIGVSYYLCITAFSEHKELGRIWGTVFASVVVAAIFMAAQLKRNSRVIWPGAWNYAFVLGIPLILHLLSVSILGQSDKLMIQHFVSFSAAGIYGAMSTIILVPQAIFSAIDNAWAPWFFNIVTQDRKPEVQKEIQEFNGKIVWIFALIIILFQLAVTEITYLMVSSEYRVGKDLLYVFSISVFVNFLYIYAVNVEYYYKKTSKISLYTFISAVFNILFNIIGIILWGYIGAAFATLLSRVLLLVLHSKEAKNLSGYPALRKDTIVLSFIIVTFSAGLIYFIQSSLFVRTIAFIVILFFLMHTIYNNFYKT